MSTSPRHGDPRETSLEDLQKGEQVGPPTTSGKRGLVATASISDLLKDNYGKFEASRTP